MELEQDAADRMKAEFGEKFDDDVGKLQVREGDCDIIHVYICNCHQQLATAATFLCCPGAKPWRYATRYTLRRNTANIMKI